MLIGPRVKRVRKLALISTRELDRLAGLAEGHAWAIEVGRRPNIESRTTIALAGVLGVSLDWLITGTGDPPTAESVRAAVERARAKAA